MYGGDNAKKSVHYFSIEKDIISAGKHDSYWFCISNFHVQSCFYQKQYLILTRGQVLSLQSFQEKWLSADKMVPSEIQTNPIEFPENLRWCSKTQKLPMWPFCLLAHYGAKHEDLNTIQRTSLIEQTKEKKASPDGYEAQPRPHILNLSGGNQMNLQLILGQFHRSITWEHVTLMSGVAWVSTKKKIIVIMEWPGKWCSNEQYIIIEKMWIQSH